MTESLFETLFRSNRVAHARGQHEVAYHALYAAMHAGSDAHDERQLRAVEAEATAQIEWIDANGSHRLATAASAGRGRRGVYAMLATQVAAHLTVLRRRGRCEEAAEQIDRSLG